MASSSFDPSQMFEFPCNQCGRLLKVKLEAVGRQARCPDCHSIQTVPQPTPNPAGPGQPGTPQTNFGSQATPQAGALGTMPNLVNPTVAEPNQASSPMTADVKPGTLDAGFPGQTIMAGQSAAPVEPTPITQQTLANPEAFGMGSSGTISSPPGNAPTNVGVGTTDGEASPEAVNPNGLGTAGAANQPQAPVNVSSSGGLSLGQSEYESQDTPTRQLFEKITTQISKIYVGQEELVLGTLVAIFSNGHVLIESVPGLGKTLFIRTLGKVLGCKFGRIQFTADLMPSDITGAPIYNMKSQEFEFRPGPVFTQFLLADEINRSPAKTHAALLEIMQEYRVTVDGTSHELERPFLVMATQNPIESEGTYNLPEAQLDRFMMKLVVDYPDAEQESRILAEHSLQTDIGDRLERDVEAVTSPEEIMSIVEANSQIRVDEKLLNYINKIVRLTRDWPQFHMGASPRAGIALMQAARTLAAFSGRDYAVPDDVVRVILPALRHRVILTAEAEVEGQDVDQLLTELVRTVEVPRL